MASIHHFEVLTSNLSHRVNQFQSQFGFKVFAHSATSDQPTTVEGEGVALHINSVVMVIRGVKGVSPPNDWISDVALHISSSTQFDGLLERLQSTSDASVLRTSCTTDTPRPLAEGLLCPAGTGDNTRTKQRKYFKVSSPFSSVCHTVICGECSCKEGWRDGGEGEGIECLLGFVKCPLLYGEPCSSCSGRFDSSSLVSRPRDVSHVDHVTFACHTHSSDDILKWYERHLGFQRLQINSKEDDNGFILDGSNGMRMLAMKYWQCSETTATLGGKDEKLVQLVFAEPLPNAGKNQVGTFLKQNSGPGVQHIAFHTENIVGVVSNLRSNGVHFITPPPEYYSLFEKMNEIRKAGESVDLLQENNILIDFEEEEEKKKYLMQVFSHPLFDRETFFLEIIQRHGAAGFGAGNIIALWKALEIHFRRNKTIGGHSGY
ncbi:PREDICTED: uncharacterized protein LOC100633625 [Amphimedon queenslandica]|uniref:VOC domain-containing protein n=1 Tax=Amphimedon queenslandica TaxID=400682 RepID=A0A1X7VMU7_AMPQE|nr:PREDICTED: uncharacterized protein LOC100633625 [Amphimedon queenslandica]|eukprot:XP_003383900.2 PREDICTED: uncharacterized protein LOC100633625 [Amphimedon queenslandica]